MKILVTGHAGYIGCALVPMFVAAGHEVHGIDSYLFEKCLIGPLPRSIPEIRKDIRDLTLEDVEGYDAVVHLAALSNDPLGDLNPDCTWDINHRGCVRVATLAKQAGVDRFLQSSTCSLYGAHGDEYLDESAEFHPVTPYGESKVVAEADISALADDEFSPTFLRNGTAYGWSPLLRGDLVVNNLTGYAYATGRVFLKSDGSSWRPLVHVEDIARAFLALVEAPRDAVHLQAFNIGATEENYQIKDVAKIVEEVVPDSVITMSAEAFNDLRNYRVTCDKFTTAFPQARPQWTVRKGVEELLENYDRYALTEDVLVGRVLQRIQTVRRLIEERELDDDLRWIG